MTARFLRRVLGWTASTSLVRDRADDGVQQIEHRHMPTQLQLTVVERLVGLRPPFNAGFYDPVFENLLLLWNLSPVEIQVMDPLGRRIGVDFSTGGALAEILNAHLWRSDAPDEPDLIFIGDPAPGPYIVRLLGIAEGNYRVGMDFFNDEGAITVDEASGESEPGEVYEHVLTYDPDTLPTLPLTLTWLPPLQEGVAIPVAAQRTLPVKFQILDGQGRFAVDDQAMVLIVDPERPGQALAAFTTEGPPGERLRILERAQMYHLTLHLSRYSLEEGKAYRLVVYAFGQPLGRTAFEVRP